LEQLAATLFAARRWQRLNLRGRVCNEMLWRGLLFCIGVGARGCGMIANQGCLKRRLRRAAPPLRERDSAAGVSSGSSPQDEEQPRKLT